MRILHTSDWHLGKYLNNRDRLPEQREVIDEICRIAETSQVHLVLITGDIFDTFVPSAAAEELFYDAIDRLSAGNTHSLSEPQFVPARPDAPEGEGYLLTVANDYSEMRSELVIADAMNLGQGPIARVKLPFRLHTPVHGWWEPAGGFLTGVPGYAGDYHRR
jgi:hypothetical protein